MGIDYLLGLIQQIIFCILLVEQTVYLKTYLCFSQCKDTIQTNKFLCWPGGVSNKPQGIALTSSGFGLGEVWRGQGEA